MLSTDTPKSSRTILWVLWFGFTFYLMEWDVLYPPLFSAGLLFGTACGMAWLGRAMNLRMDRLSTGLVCLQTGVSLLACDFVTKHVTSMDVLAIFGVGLCAQLILVAAAWGWRIRGKESLDFKLWFYHFIFYGASVLVLVLVTTWCYDFFLHNTRYYWRGIDDMYSKTLRGLAGTGVLMILLELHRRRAVKYSI